MDEIAIKCRGLKKTYGKKENAVEALKGIDLEIYKGKLTLLVGPSGSGKTTLLSIFATILTPDAGDLYVLDQEMNLLSEKQRAGFRSKHLGIIFQSFFLIPTLTVAENISIPLMIDGLPHHVIKDKVLAMVERMNLKPYANTFPANLSKGQQQRVAIARAMINDSQIILCDEPTSSLDQATGFEVMSFLHELAKKSFKAVLVVTHDHRTFSFADQIININDGYITDEKHA